jgi:hypothetical protein
MALHIKGQLHEIYKVFWHGWIEKIVGEISRTNFENNILKKALSGLLYWSKPLECRGKICWISFIKNKIIANSDLFT